MIENILSFKYCYYVYEFGLEKFTDYSNLNKFSKSVA